MKSFVREIEDNFFYLLFAAIMVFLIIDVICGHSVKTIGVIVEKRYQEERTYITMSTSTDANGNTHTYPVTHHDPPEWHFIVRSSTGKIVTVDTPADLYYRTNQGEQVPFSTRYGGITKLPYFRTALSY